MDISSYDQHDAIVNYIDHVKNLVNEAETLIGMNPFNWLVSVLEVEQKHHSKECERIIARMEESHY